MLDNNVIHVHCDSGAYITLDLNEALKNRIVELSKGVAMLDVYSVDCLATSIPFSFKWKFPNTDVDPITTSVVVTRAHYYFTAAVNFKGTVGVVDLVTRLNTVESL